MSYSNSSMGSGSRSNRGAFEFGRTYVIKPQGRHLATVVWLHGLGDNGSSWSQLQRLPLPNIKWICPTAPTRPVDIVGGYACTAWFNMGELYDERPDDIEGLDASAAHIANLLSTEPAGVKLAIGGFGMGAATALYSATCFAQGKYSNGYPYPVGLRAIVGISSWLPGSRNLRSKMEASYDAARRAASLPILLCHGLGDEVVPPRYSQQSYNTLNQVGFLNLSFRTYEGVGHHSDSGVMNDICNWLTRQGF